MHLCQEFFRENIQLFKCHARKLLNFLRHRFQQLFVLIDWGCNATSCSIFLTFQHFDIIYDLWMNRCTVIWHIYLLNIIWSQEQFDNQQYPWKFVKKSATLKPIISFCVKKLFTVIFANELLWYNRRPWLNAPAFNQVIIAFDATVSGNKIVTFWKARGLIASSLVTWLYNCSCVSIFFFQCLR